MPRAHEIFAQMPQETAASLFGFLHEKEKPLYRATIESLAKQRKLRTVFVERKPRTERHTWMQEALGRRNSEAIAAHLLQIWLVAAHSKVLCDFLDGLGIKHDENGTIETLPSAPPKAELARVVETLLSRHDRAVVTVYLHAFQALDDKGWSTLAELLAEDDRLRLAPAAQTPEG
jgi:hypothetical protein